MAKNTISTPIKDGVMADNSTLSSNEIKKRIDTAAASVLPEVSGEDEGKVLTVGSDGSWEAATVPNELPVPEADDIGKLAGVVSDGSTGAQYGLVEAPVPYTGTKVVVIECTDSSIATSECVKLVDAFNSNALVIAKVTASSGSAYQNLSIPYYVIMAFDPSSTSAYFTLKGYTINTIDLQNATAIYLQIMGGESWGSVSWGTLNT